MSEDVLGGILKLSYGRKLFPMEDLYVGFMVRELGDVTPTDNRKHFNLVYSGVKTDCEMNDLFLAHRVVDNNQMKLIQRARKALLTCLPHK